VDEDIVDEIYKYSNTLGENPYMSLVAFLEDYYQCSGICRPDMFFATRSI
jgi:hypothetical protein